MITHKILRNLLKIFAITVVKVSPENLSYIQPIVSKFLQNIDEKYREEYLNFFKSELENFTEKEQRILKKRSLNSLKIISLCAEINSDLELKHKYVLLFYLIELSKKCLLIEQSYEYIKLVGDSIGIQKLKIETLITGLNKFDNLNYKTFIFNNFKIVDFALLEANLTLLRILNANVSIDGFKYETGDNALFGSENIMYFDNHPILLRDLTKNYNKKNHLLRKFRISNLTYREKNKEILKPLSIEFCSGELIAVMGRSGSGKSTFLKAVGEYGKSKNISGEILESSEFEFFIVKTVLMDQNPGFIPYYSVYENVSATQKFFGTDSDVDDLLDFVGIKHKREEVAVKFFNKPFNLSGGELKRLSIAMALVTNPDILLLDEPLSGLSSADVMEIVKLLRMLADNSKVVFCSLHQPDYNVFLAFDKILFIDEEGYCIFFGKPTECFEYFRNQTDNISLSTLPEICKNPAVLFKLVESRKHYDNMAYQRKFTPSELYQNFLKNNKLENKAVYNKIKVFHNKKFCKTLRNFIKLIFISDLKNYKRSFALFFTVLFCGLIFSALLSSPKQFYYNDNFPIWIFVIQLSSVFIGMMISVHEGFYIYEYLKFLRRILKFHNAEALTLLIKYFLISFILSLVLVFPGSLIMKCEFYGMKLFLWIWILMLWGAFAGILISKLSKNLVVAFVLIPFIIMPQIILSGAFVRYDKLNLFSTKASSDVPYIADLVPLRWSLEAITADFYMNNPYGKIITPFSSQIKLNNFKIKNFYILNSNDSEISGEKKKNDFNNVFTDKLQKENNILINLIDSEFRKYENIDFIRKKYSNIGIDRIIRNYETIDNTNIENFPRIFHKDVEFVNNRVFLNGYKYFVGMILNTFYYNFLVMFFYVFIMFLAIYILLKTEKI